MDVELARRAHKSAPPWLRYMLTLSEMTRTGEAWVVAAGDDVALWDTDEGPVLPVWPTSDLADSVADEEARPVAIERGEFLDRLLPFVFEADASVALFPNFEDDVLADPEAVVGDLAEFAAETPVVAGLLVADPAVEVYDEWALLQLPEVEDIRSEVTNPGAIAHEPTGDRYADMLCSAGISGVLWMLDVSAEEAVVGIVLDDRPALALFISEHEAAKYAERVGGDATPLPVGADTLVRGWMLVAYGGGWAVAVSPDANTAVFVEPTRMALELAEVCSEE
jgi:hypothetical protein